MSVAETKRLTVVIIGYQASDIYWRRCIQSVLRNIGPDDEVICIDDGSREKPIVISEFAKQDNRILPVLCSENRGQAFARNVGLERARCKYVAFVDCDDEVVPSTYANAISELDASGFDVAVYGVRTVWISARLEKENTAEPERIGEMTAEKLAQIYHNCLFCYPWNKIYRRKFLLDNGIMFKEHCIPREDEVFNLDCVVANAKWVMISNVGHVYYRYDGSSLSRYRRYCDESTRMVKASWGKCRRILPEGQRFLEGIEEESEEEIAKANWENLWRRGSPYSMYGRWKWLRSHNELGGCCFYIKTAVFMFLRRYFYFSVIQRMHIRKIWPEAKELSTN